MNKLLSIIKNIKTIVIILGLPTVLTIFYQLHIERTEVLKDKISFLEKQLDLTTYDKAENLLQSQKNLYQQEIDNIKQNATMAQKELSYLLNFNDDKLTRLQSIKNALQSVQAIDGSVTTIDKDNLLKIQAGVVINKMIGQSSEISSFPERTKEEN